MIYNCNKKFGLNSTNKFCHVIFKHVIEIEKKPYKFNHVNTYKLKYMSGHIFIKTVKYDVHKISHRNIILCGKFQII